MELLPNDPPGHARRKLRGFVGEIARLRAAGYTMSAIHQTFVDAGIDVGKSTIQRECARLSSIKKAEKPTTRPTLAETAILQEAVGQPPRGVDVASFFTEAQSNPLFNRRKKP